MKMLRLLPALLAALVMAAQPCSLGWSCQTACPMPDCSGPTTQWSAVMPCCCEAGPPADREDPGTSAGTPSKGQSDGPPVIRAAAGPADGHEAALLARSETQRPASSLLIQNVPLLI